MMIEVKELIDSPQRVGNYYSPDAYIQGDFEFGLLENRDKTRLLALSAPFLEALYAGLEVEVGPAAAPVSIEFGRSWGRKIYRRLMAEIEGYYDRPVADMEMSVFLQCLREAWKTHGWGLIDFDFSYYNSGFIVVTLRNAAFTNKVIQSDEPSCFVETGILRSFFSLLTGQNLDCVQTECESLGVEKNSFVLGLSERIEKSSAWLEEGHDHDTIMHRLCEAQPA